MDEPAKVTNRPVVYICESLHHRWKDGDSRHSDHVPPQCNLAGLGRQETGEAKSHQDGKKTPSISTYS